jgi:hypothetical protein
MVRRLADKQNWRDEDVRTLRDEFRLFDTGVVVGSDGSLETVLLRSWNWNQHHIGSTQEISHFRPCHVRQEVLHLLFRPERAGLCVDLSRDAGRFSSLIAATRVRLTSSRPTIICRPSL